MDLGTTVCKCGFLDLSEYSLSLLSSKTVKNEYFLNRHNILLFYQIWILIALLDCREQVLSASCFSISSRSNIYWVMSKLIEYCRIDPNKHTVSQKLFGLERWNFHTVYRLVYKDFLSLLDCYTEFSPMLNSIEHYWNFVYKHNKRNISHKPLAPETWNFHRFWTWALRCAV